MDVIGLYINGLIVPTVGALALQLLGGINTTVGHVEDVDEVEDVEVVEDVDEDIEDVDDKDGEIVEDVFTLPSTTGDVVHNGLRIVGVAPE